MQDSNNIKFNLELSL